MKIVLCLDVNYVTERLQSVETQVNADLRRLLFSIFSIWKYSLTVISFYPYKRFYKDREYSYWKYEIC